MAKYHLQVINLDRSPNRMMQLSQQLAAQKIQFCRLSATDGRCLSKSDREKYSAMQSLIYYGRRLSTGEIGCFRSHQRAAEVFLASDCEVGLVLEDDAVIPNNLPQHITNLLDQVQLHAGDNWELINLGNAPKHNKHARPISGETCDFELIQAFLFPKRTTALLWSRKGARKFLEETRIIRAPVDQHLHSVLSSRSSGLATRPPMIPHGDFASDINSEPDAASVRQTERPSIWYQIRRWMRKHAARRSAFRAASE